MWGGNRTYFPIKAFFLNCYVLLREFQLKRLRSVKSNTLDLNHLLTSPAKSLTYMLIVPSSFLEIRKQFAAERRWFPMTFLVMVGHSLSCSLTVKTSFSRTKNSQLILSKWWSAQLLYKLFSWSVCYLR